jgi:hypothetical protein
MLFSSEKVDANMLRKSTMVQLVFVLFLHACRPSSDEGNLAQKTLGSFGRQNNTLTISRQYLQRQGRVIRGITFDKRVIVQANTPSIVFENNVFNQGIHIGKSQEKRRMEFRNNLIRTQTDSGMSMNYGDVFVDNVVVMDYSGWNPHFIHLTDGKGRTLFRGNVFWFIGPNGESMAEGDGIMIFETDEGTREENHVIIERNIFLPNSTGPNGTDNLSCTAFTYMCRQLNSRVTARRNTLFTNSIGGCNVGENWVTRAGAIEAITSNLFVGDINNQGSKIRNLGAAETDVVLAKNADYNACYRCAEGNLHTGGAGKGYHNLDFSGSALIGEHDLDDVDPRFFDWTRNPIRWDTSLGGPGTMDSVAARLAPNGGHSVQELLDYIRAGYRPQNLAYQGRGNQAEDIGAVDIYSEHLTLSLPAQAQEGDGLLADPGVLSLSSASSSSVTVRLSSSDPGELKVPENVTLEAGALRAEFVLQVIQDQELDGVQRVFVTAQADGYSSGSASMDIQDDESATGKVISVNLPDSVVEGSSDSFTGEIRLSKSTPTALSVDLESDDTTEITVPERVIVPAQNNRVLFAIQVMDDTQVDGNQGVVISASATGWVTGHDTLEVMDDDREDPDDPMDDTPKDEERSIVGQVACASQPPAKASGFAWLVLVSLACLVAKIRSAIRGVPTKSSDRCRSASSRPAR